MGTNIIVSSIFHTQRIEKVSWIYMLKKEELLPWEMEKFNLRIMEHLYILIEIKNTQTNQRNTSY